MDKTWDTRSHVLVHADALLGHDVFLNDGLFGVQHDLVLHVEDADQPRDR
jgi:hypothetical protein